MHRLFVAIRPPADVRAMLLSLMGGIAGARWQDDDQLHLTLRFIGEVDARRADDLAAALSTIRFAPFPIALAGLGKFERKGHVDTIWAGVQPRDALAGLHRKIDRACVSVGLPPDDRAYLPHITLARLNRSASLPDAFLATHAGLSSPPFTIDRFALYESHLSQSGALYHVAALYPASGHQP
ncbi:MAG TPA: RNA 2',3'-cyclic phosphodiesterase [Sphingobium sp.]|nr:RNA 2',3'-cyclic phosphodiesterase [Sphingobium sp.]